MEGERCSWGAHHHGTCRTVRLPAGRKTTKIIVLQTSLERILQSCCQVGENMYKFCCYFSLPATANDEPLSTSRIICPNPTGDEINPKASKFSNI